MIEFQQINPVALVAAFLFGAILGSLYFGALWLTLRRLSSRRRPALFYMASLAGRLGLLLIAIYLVLDSGHWTNLLALLFGFILLRVVLTRKLGPTLVARMTHSPPGGAS